MKFPGSGCHLLAITMLLMASAGTSAAQLIQWIGRMHGFGPDKVWASYSAESPLVVLTGDFNGDGLDDLVYFHRSTPGKEGHVDVRLNIGGEFAAAVRWHNSFCVGSEIPKVGDFNGDGRSDIATFVRSSQGGEAQGDVYVGLSSGSAFVSSRWHAWFCVGNEVPVVGDFNGDGRDDVATCTRGTTADVYVALSTGASFSGTAVKWHDNFCPGEAIPLAGDFNGDGRDDLAAFLRHSLVGQEADVRVTLSLASAPGTFTGNELWHDTFCYHDEIPAVGDLNADGRDDILTLAANGSDSAVFVALSNGAGAFVHTKLWHASLNTLSGSVALHTGRFNADLNADVMTTSQANWPWGGMLGIATVAVCGEHASPMPVTTGSDRAKLATDFGYGTMGVPSQNLPLTERPVPDERYLLVVLLAAPAAGPPVNRAAFAMTNAQAESLCFGPSHPNISSYFAENSGGKFRFRRAAIQGGNGVIGPIQVDAPPEDTWQFALETIDPLFNFASYDLDGDGNVDTRELCILVIDNFTAALGANRYRTIVADGKTVRQHMGAAGHLSAFQNPTHEMSHSLGTWDLYNEGCDAKGVTLMSCTAGLVDNAYWHLDAWHKMRLGWLLPWAYDVSEYPGGAIISPAQALGHLFFRPPVILYDKRRATGTHEYYMLEWRDPQYVDSGAGWAGYDQSAAGTGLATWYVRTQENHNPDRDEYAIGAGENGDLESTPSGDDLISGNRIIRGPNGILESKTSGDDIYIGDNTCLLTLTPSNHASRNTVELHSDPTVGLIPNWWTKPELGVSPADIPVGITLRTCRMDYRGYVEWGANFSPWLNAPSASRLVGNRVHNFSGNFGIRDRGSDGVARLVVRDRDGRQFALAPVLAAGENQWNPLFASFRVPLGVPTGSDYTLRVNRDVAGLVVSNAWPVTVENAYHDFLTAHFSASERVLPDLAGPLADPDGDGLVNAIEFMTGGNPRDGGDGGEAVQSLFHGDRCVLLWSCPKPADGYFTVHGESSTDLKVWSVLPEPVRTDMGNTIQYSVAVPKGTNKRMFLRLGVECPSGLD